MQTRILACAAGGLLGALLTPAVDGFGLGPTLGIAACAVGGLALGYLASILVDVFSGEHKVNAGTSDR